jgi:chromosome segregation ATPase
MMRGTPPPTWEQTCLDLDKKLADSRQHVTELENRLRALWDKLEGERKHYMERIVELEKENERINRLERAGDMLCAAAAFLGWHGEIEQWNKVKGQKP